LIDKALGRGKRGLDFDTDTDPDPDPDFDFDFDLDFLGRMTLKTCMQRLKYCGET
jgi:hypothetical protein